MESIAASTGTDIEAMPSDHDDETRLAQIRRIEEQHRRMGERLYAMAQDRLGNSPYQQLDVSSLPDQLGVEPTGPGYPFSRGPRYHPRTFSDPDESITVENVKDSQRETLRGSHIPNGSVDGRQESLNKDSPPTVSSSNHTDDSIHSQPMDGVVSYASTNSSNSLNATTSPVIKIEFDGNVQPAQAKQTLPSPLPPSQTSTPLTPSIPQLPSEPIPPTEPALGSAPLSAKRRRLSKEVKLQVTNFKPRTTVPNDISTHELARQSIEAALASRLNPFVLHPSEYQTLKDHICHLHVSAYLNVRNRILRLWVRNPLVTVTPEEAAGCALASKWLGLAEIAYEWLVRNGYINFGCLEIPKVSVETRKKTKKPRETIVVIGGGMSGLGCARQLEGLITQYGDRWTSFGQDTPRVIVLEGRARIGGRIYSHPLHNQASKKIPKHLRCTAELGAHIITGFERGNPLNMIIRGQLALHYYPLKDNSSLYDIDGKVVNHEHDRLVEKLFNDILERASAFRHRHQTPLTIEGDRALIEAGKDPTGDGGKPISQVEQDRNAVINQPQNLEDQGLHQVPAGLDKLTRKALLVPGSRAKVPAGQAAEAMGWQLASSESTSKDIDLDTLANSVSHPTLGMAMDEAIKQYQQLLNLSPQDLRLLNWHFANLEYANAANVAKLSLGGWDQDIGNEFDGEHAQVVGGYIQVPHGILQSPHPLDLRTRHVVSKICYDSREDGERRAKVICSNGETFDASHVVLTTPLGVLKQSSVAFEPELPSWKKDSIERLGFGNLNKVILVYDRPFWDVDQDMIGLLRDTDIPESNSQLEYSTNRGRFYLFWNCIKTSGRPLLIALMAGDAAVQAENLSDGQIVAEVQHQLCKMFRHKSVPQPLETIVTRWGQDPFAGGTYSYVGPTAHSDDYDAMARSVGNLHFAGEATCGTHPATVHGAYISGLRAASEVISSMLGPISIPDPVIRTTPPKADSAIRIDLDGPSKAPQTQSRAPEPLLSGETFNEKQARLEAFEADILHAIFSKIGPRPDKPGKMGANPFLLFSKDTWAECKAKCDAARQGALGNPTAKASRNEIRAALGQMWREASEETKRPYLQQTVENKASNQESAASFTSQLASWDGQAIEIRKQYIDDHPDVLSPKEEDDMWQALGVFAGQDRKAKRLSGYADHLGAGEAPGT